MQRIPMALVLATLMLVVTACSEPPEVELSETVEIIPLPEEVASLKLAHQIGTEVYDEIGALVASNPTRFNPREVDYQINWGRLEDFNSGSSTFYIKIVGKSALPFEEDPRVQELMHIAIKSVHEKIDAQAPGTIEL